MENFHLPTSTLDNYGPPRAAYQPSSALKSLTMGMSKAYNGDNSQQWPKENETTLRTMPGLYPVCSVPVAAA